MKSSLKSALVIVSLSLVAATARCAVIHFDDATVGKLAPGWVATNTGSGKAVWSVETDADAPSKPNVLKQSGEATFPICIKEGSSFTNGFVFVKFKPISGKKDQAGGVIWRCRDADNYYIARANALENNVTVYHTIKGKRVAFKNMDAPVASGVWHSLRVDFHGNNCVVYFDGKKLIEATDDSFPGAGRVGLWTKADSVTAFDDFMFGERP